MFLKKGTLKMTVKKEAVRLPGRVAILMQILLQMMMSIPQV